MICSFPINKIATPRKRNIPERRPGSQSGTWLTALLFIYSHSSIYSLMHIMCVSGDAKENNSTHIAEDAYINK
jgi:hypothetical protein